MVLWFARGLRRGVVTTHYPFAERDAWTADLPTPPTFRPAHLTVELADRLAAVCPSNALHREDQTLVYDLGACTACRRCQAVAPEVVRPAGVFELAATDRGQLVKRIPLAGEPS